MLLSYLAADGGVLSGRITSILITDKNKKIKWDHVQVSVWMCPREPILGVSTVNSGDSAWAFDYVLLK